MMILIPCDADCKHQNEGYCCLDQTSKVTNADGGCAYYEKGTKDRALVPTKESFSTHKGVDCV